ncbi:MAG: protein translocase subunit SecD [Zetaproteobacteria bacterium]|nr:protein translocase subunit SecD [Zetaproteobacteria bacterium]
MKTTRWRSTIVALVSILAIYQITPTLIYFSQSKEIRNDEEAFLQKVPSFLPQSHVKLGLDLQGGIQLVLGVETESAIADKLSRVGIETKRWANDEGYTLTSSYVPEGEQFLRLQLEDSTKVQEFRERFRQDNPHLIAENKGEGTLEYRYKDEEMRRIRQSASEQAEKVIRNRVDQWGVSEPMINRRADGSILVQLPGFRDPEKAKGLLGRTVQLKFKIVDDEFKGFNKVDRSKLPEGIKVANNGGNQAAFSSEDRDELNAFLAPYIPEDRSLHFEKQELGDGTEGRYTWISYVTHATTELSGEDIREAVVGQASSIESQPIVSMTFTPAGGRQFARVTGENINKRMAIVLDGVIESAPVIQGKIPNGQAQITLGGNRSYNQAVEEGTKLALILKSGAIPATIKILEERQVGSTLGPELASQGIQGILLGLIAVLFFMLVYYRRPGLLACMALVLNAALLLAVMAAFGFALTLPGIAGFVLTLGMAVDANVLINERIRQEIYEGRHPRKAVDSGFDKVFSTIIDANLTTLIAAMVLLETNGSGPIRGFAITLIFGLLVSLFTSLYCTKLFFHLAMTRIPDNKLRTWLGAKTEKQKLFNIDWLRYGTKSTAVACLLALSVVITMGVRGMNFGVDFLGGTEIFVEFAQDVEAEELHKVGDDANVDDLVLQSVEGSKKQYLIRYDESGQRGIQKAGAADIFQIFKASLEKNLADKGPKIESVDFVGPQVGQELRTQGILSVLYAILAVIIYIGFRFDMRFSPGALIKMFLDIIIMLGFYVFFWVSFDLVAVAAFLTVVGYSVNDTIVIYDRIRENLTNFPRRALKENINLAINETLGRSINTSLTTALSLSGILIMATGQIWNFAMAMTIGVIVATVSSILVASTFVVWFEKMYREKNAKPSTKQASA